MHLRCHVLLLAVLSASPILAQSSRVLLQPPANYRSIKVDGQRYVRGIIYLEEHADTALLTSYGFRDWRFAGRGFRHIKYEALWPRATVLDSLPPQVSGVEYPPDAAARAGVAVLIGWSGPPAKDFRDLELWAEKLRACRFRYALPDDRRPDFTAGGVGYIRGQFITYDASDTTALRKLGFKEFRPSGAPYRGMEPVAMTPDQSLPDLHHFQCVWPVTLDLETLPESVLDIAGNGALRDAGHNPDFVSLSGVSIRFRHNQPPGQDGVRH